ncbi:hypothetical protein BJ741DRAFT_353594 [Chytriomyces cf. hyalinus JEL632]|nr:hypothetical protein BJ741DRAFT_353594 [Chytriomyces cf. hyalinus JEL632]
MKRSSANMPAVVIARDDTSNTLLLSSMGAGSLEHSEVQRLCILALLTSFSQASVANPDRLIYSLAGKMFYPWSPVPFGGTRTNPGFARYEGRTPAALLKFIVSESLEVYQKYEYREALQFLISAANQVLALQESGAKDEMDELMLKGMKKSGSIEWFGAAVIPRALREGRNAFAQARGVVFTPRQKG